MKTTIAFLWHMHQPYYRDKVTGESTMPWVRLHGIHSYYDMIKLYERFPNVRGTINFVPSLVEQLLAYVEEGKSDTFLEHTLVPAEHLSPQQKAFLLRNFFMANPERKIAPYNNYQKLYTRRGLDPSNIDFQQAIRFFSTQDYLDLQVYYNLVWFGFAAREEIPEINTMLNHGGHFTEADKLFVIEAQKRILKNLFEALRHAANSSNVELCTTPYYHPIFPLILDTSYAFRCQPHASLPHQIKLPWVASAQLTNALEKMEHWTGKRPKGLWPAEGSVCPEMIPILADAGINWMATDDKILRASLQKKQGEMDVHQPFTATHEGKSVSMVFRDHGLSDAIGFVYSKMPAKDAVNNFLSNIKIIDGGTNEDRLVTIILDGENPWEFYPESGKEFLTELFTTFERENIPTATISGYLEKHKPTTTIDKLFTGSWIDANFNIWIGKSQKNQAWGYIRKTLDEIGDVLGSGRNKQDPKINLAFESLCAACGSDWFWWYDDDFDSAFKPDFDRLFRQHLKNVFTILGKDIPIFLFEPIYRFRDTKGEFAEPSGFMFPSIDGMRTSFFEWANSTRFSVHGRGGAMAMSAELFETISFGFNTESLFLRIDPVDPEKGFVLADDEELIFNVHDGDKHFKLSLKKEDGKYKMKTLEVKGADKVDNIPVEWAIVNVLEMAVPFSSVGFKPGEKMTITIALNRHGLEARRYSHIHFVVPDATYEQRMWSV